jgi:hypothetical protein
MIVFEARIIVDMVFCAILMAATTTTTTKKSLFSLLVAIAT